MAVRYFCDYCGEAMPTPGEKLVIKLVEPGTDALDEVRVFKEICPGCYTAIKNKFREFIKEMGDDAI